MGARNCVNLSIIISSGIPRVLTSISSLTYPLTVTIIIAPVINFAFIVPLLISFFSNTFYTRVLPDNKDYAYNNYTENYNFAFVVRIS